MTKGTLVVLSGPSGCGKGTVLKELLSRNENIFLSVSATTRSPRPGEENGVHYFFLSREEFESRIRSGGMLEYASYVGNYYGTPRDAVEQRLAEGKDVILEIEVQGAMQVKKLCPEAVTVFILPPDFETLKARLTGRGTENEATVNNRLQKAREEMEYVSGYDYAVVNHLVPVAAEDIEAILRAEKLKTKNQKEMIEGVLRYDA